jgi:hypothetical protein
MYFECLKMSRIFSFDLRMHDYSSCRYFLLRFPRVGTIFAKSPAGTQRINLFSLRLSVTAGNIIKYKKRKNCTQRHRDAKNKNCKVLCFVDKFQLTCSLLSWRLGAKNTFCDLDQSHFNRFDEKRGKILEFQFLNHYNNG